MLNQYKISFTLKFIFTIRMVQFTLLQTPTYIIDLILIRHFPFYHFQRKPIAYLIKIYSNHLIHLIHIKQPSIQYSMLFFKKVPRLLNFPILNFITM